MNRVLPYALAALTVAAVIMTFTFLLSAEPASAIQNIYIGVKSENGIACMCPTEIGNCVCVIN